MKVAKPSRTSDIPAIMRAVHQTRDDEPKILADAIAPKLVDMKSIDAWLDTILSHPFAPQWRAAKAIAIFEIDHPATQDDKRERLLNSAIEVPDNLTFVPVDFEIRSLGDALRTKGFAFDRLTFCSWVGVTQYLTVAAIVATLAFVLSLPSGSEIVLSVILPQDALSGIEADAVATAAAKSAEVGEPWLSRFDPSEFALQLRRMGFSEVILLAPKEVQERYLTGRHDGLAARHGEQIMRAVV